MCSKRPKSFSSICITLLLMSRLLPSGKGLTSGAAFISSRWKPSSWRGGTTMFQRWHSVCAPTTEILNRWSGEGRALCQACCSWGHPRTSSLGEKSREKHAYSAAHISMPATCRGPLRNNMREHPLGPPSATAGNGNCKLVVRMPPWVKCMYSFPIHVLRVGLCLGGLW